MSSSARNPNPEEPRDAFQRLVVPSPTTGGVSKTAEAKAAVRGFSIGLVRLGLPNVKRRIVVFLTIAWLPLFLLSMKDGLQ